MARSLQSSDQKAGATAALLSFVLCNGLCAAGGFAPGGGNQFRFGISVARNGCASGDCYQSTETSDGNSCWPLGNPGNRLFLEAAPQQFSADACRRGTADSE